VSVATATWRRSRGVLLLAFAIALAAGVLVTSGATLLARVRAVVTPPAAGRYYVVSRGPLAEATRAALAQHAEASIVAEHGIDDLLGETAALRTGGETLRVLEVRMTRRPTDDAAGEVAILQQLDGVVDVIALTPPIAPAPPLGQGIVGGSLITLGVVLFVVGLVLTATMAVRDSRDELAVRYLLGAEPASLWRPLGNQLGMVVLAGTLGAVLSTWLGVSLLFGRSEALSGITGPLLSPASRATLLAAVCLFVVGAVASAALAARRAVLRITDAPVELIGLIGLCVLLGAAPARAADVVPPSDWQVLRSTGRELAACNRNRIEAERSLAETEVVAVRAYATQDALRLRLANIQRDEHVRMVENWRDTCAALEMRRAELRVVHGSSLFPGPPIAPRRPPVTGGMAIAWGEAGLPGRPHAFRNGIGLRVRPGEQVRATAAGKVVYAGDLAGAGKVVVVSHGRRTFSVYGRVAETLVVRGMQVEAGEPVAAADDRSGSGPAVIYFSVRERGKPIDPVGWLRDDPSRADEG
jgi:murein DD-endopeptidase MepM/ murein hydrolase activator NlpD